MKDLIINHYTHSIEFHGNDFEAVRKPHTVDDMQFGVIERYDLYQDGDFSGSIAIWNGAKFGFLFNGVRIVLNKIDLHVRKTELV